MSEIIVAVISIAYSMCVTFAAIQLDRPSILWWYLMLIFITSIQTKKENENND